MLFSPMQSFFFNLLFYFWLCWVFVALCRLSLVVASRGYTLLKYIEEASVVAEHRLLHMGFRSCSTWDSVVVAQRLSVALVTVFPDQG